MDETIDYDTDDRMAAADHKNFPQIEGFKIIGKLGEGGMGIVWRAIQLGTDREVALKLMSSRMFGSQMSQHRFEREVKLAARLDHPNIATIHEAGLHKGVYYYAMRLVHGVPLDDYITNNQLDQREILELMQKVCDAVGHAHEMGIMHRDLKPSNVVVNEKGRPFVLDFGLAKAMEETGSPDHTSTHEGEVVGTPAYMSPEQARGRVEEVDTRSDVYALGVMMYMLLTGKHPTDLTGTRFEVLARIVGGEIKPLSEVSRDTNPELEALVMKALDRDRAHRFADGTELTTAIEQYLEDSKATTGRVQETKTQVAKNKSKAPMVVAAVLLLVALIGAGIWSLNGPGKKNPPVVKKPPVQPVGNDGKTFTGDTIKPEDGLIDLFPLIDLKKDVVRQKHVWSRDGQSIRCQNTTRDLSPLRLPLRIEGGYEIRGVVTAHFGEGDSFHLILPTGKKAIIQAHFRRNGIHETLEVIGDHGQWLSKKETLIAEDEPAHVLVRVEVNKGEVSIAQEVNGTTQASWRGEVPDAAPSFIDHRTVSDERTPLLGVSRSSEVSIRSLGIRMLSGEAKLLRPLTKPVQTAKAKPLVGDNIRPDNGWVDVGPLIDLTRDAIKGVWSQPAPGTYEVTRGLHSELRLPVQPNGEFELELTAVPLTDRRNLQIDLPFADKKPRVRFSDKGADIQGISSTLEPAGKLDGKMRLLTRIRKQGDQHVVEVERDGKAIFSWSTSKPLSPAPLSIKTAYADMRISDVRVRMLSGEAILLRPPGTSVKAKPPNDDTITPNDDWFDLLAPVDVAVDGVGGTWRRENGEIVGIHGLGFPVVPVGNFEWEIEFTPALGSGPLLNFTFPHPSGRAFLAVIDKPGLHDWHSAQSRKVTRVIKSAPRASVGEKHILKMKYSTQGESVSIVATIDGKPWLDWSGNTRQLTSDTLGSRSPAVWSSSQLTVHASRLRMLSGEAKLVRPSGKANPPVGTIIAENGAVELLDFVDPKLDAVYSLALSSESNWTRVSDGLQVKGGNEGVIKVPVVTNGSYELTCEFTRRRLTGTDRYFPTVGVYLPVGDGQTMVFLNHEAPGRVSGIETVNGFSVGHEQNPTATDIGVLPDNQRHKLVVRVLLQGKTIHVKTTVNGSPFFEWEGPESALGVWKARRIDGWKGFGLVNKLNHTVFRSLKLKMIEGEAKVLRPAAIPAGIDDRPGEIRQLSGHVGSVHDVALIPGTKQVLSVSWDKTLRLWDWESGRELKSIPHKQKLGSVSVSPDGKYALVGETWTYVRMYDTKTWEKIRDYKTSDGPVDALMFAPDSRSFLAGVGDGKITLHRVEDDRLVRTYEGHKALAYGLAFLPDDKTFVSGDAEGRLIHWNRETGEKIADFEAHGNNVRCLSVSRDGRRLLTSGGGRYIRLWNLSDHSMLQEFGPHDMTVSSVAFLPGDNHAISSSHDGAIRMWDLVAQKMIHELKAKTACTNHLALTKDARYAVTGGGYQVISQKKNDGDFALRVWRLPVISKDDSIREKGPAGRGGGRKVGVGGGGGGKSKP